MQPPGRPVIALDAMGGDRAPQEIVAGALRAVDELDVDILLVGSPEAIDPLVPPGARGIEVLPTSEVIAMHDEPAAAVRSKRDSSIVRCAEAVRDGRASAMVGAGNTGATMAAALLRFGRVRGVARPAIAVPIPIPGANRRQLLVDAGATVDPEPAWLVQWALLAREYARFRLGVEDPSIGLLSNGEEAGKGDALRKEAFALLSEIKGFVGNVEGGDLARPSADVILTDGFTGNVALKTIEGAMLALAGLVFSVLDEPEWGEMGPRLKVRMLEAAADLLPDNTGGALLLGVKGICIISHGSSSAAAIVNAVRVARDCVEAGIVERLTASVAESGMRDAG
ncbi:MAG: phosphate:acyl-(acyl carrier protein) acyltransferase [Actinomycetia bacterium]|nr:phosphate:acyl-(acyl carrier protein) acyltransferase [Actinomycetes bacterium]